MAGSIKGVSIKGVSIKGGRPNTVRHKICAAEFIPTWYAHCASDVQWRVVRQFDTMRDRLCRADFRSDENPRRVKHGNLLIQRSVTTLSSVLPI